VSSGEEEAAFARPTSPMAMFIMGGKGSGKSHLMRYYSFPVQLIRRRRNEESLLNALVKDGYIGIYARCGGLDAHRFQGKGQTADLWAALFAYYFELWVADRVIAAIQTLTSADELGPDIDRSIACATADLFDVTPTPFDSLAGVQRHLADLRKKLDYAVNNAAITNRLDAEVLVSRGRLFFGVPSIVCANVPRLKDILFLYLLDEFENFTRAQQIYINTLIREREGPVAFKVGARLYGIRTRQTLSGGESNLQGSEYEELRLDERLRNNSEAYKIFAQKLLWRRLSATLGAAQFNEPSADLEGFFSEPDLDWNSKVFANLLSSKPSAGRPHFVALRDKLSRGLKERVVVGLRTEDDITTVVETVSFPNYPLLEKLCILHIYQKWFRSANVLEAARYARENATAFIKGTRGGKFDEFVSKYKGDMIAQLLRENGQKQIYAGLPDFIRMSEGLPRTLITILKHVYDWSIYLGEEPFRGGKVSIRAQERGVIEAAEWFLDQMLMEGDDGVRVRSSIERLAQLFRTNRFADKPVETSLIAFSVDESQMSEEARRILLLAQNTSLIINIPRGQRERNSEQITSKLELNVMLAPRWDLPIARRGVVSFTPAEGNVVFEYDNRQAFESLVKNWESKMSAPFFGRPRSAFGGLAAQSDLFE
jgi:hypothetical protein